ncbi:MAG: TonB family protein [Chthoniobacterales bacterium]
MIVGLRRNAAGWGASVTLHAALFLAGGLLLIRDPLFGVQEAPSSAEVELVASTETPEPPTPVNKPEENPPEPAPVTSPVAPKIKEGEPDDMAIPVSLPEPRLPAPQQAATPTPVPKRHAASPAKFASNKSQAPSGGQKGVRQAQPDYLRNPPPAYPQQARIEHRQGVVLLMVSVNASGDPTSVSVSRSSGYSDFDQAAMHAVRRWKFRPASAGGICIPSTVGIPVNFELH